MNKMSNPVKDSTKLDLFALQTKREATSTNECTTQVVEPKMAPNRHQVGKRSYCPMEAQCRELWGHPIRDIPQSWCQPMSLWTNEIVPARSRPIKWWHTLMSWQSEPMAHVLTKELTSETFDSSRIQADVLRETEEDCITETLKKPFPPIEFYSIYKSSSLKCEVILPMPFSWVIFFDWIIILHIGNLNIIIRTKYCCFHIHFILLRE